MPFRFFSSSISILAIYFLSGCTGAPDLPKLSSRKPHPIKEVVLGDRYDSSSIRRIFAAVNVNGQLDALKPIFENSTDEELAVLGDFLNRYLNQEGSSPGGLLQLLDRRVQEGSFSQALSSVRRWAAKNDPIRRMLLRVIAMPELPELAAIDIRFLDPHWTDVAGRAVEKGRSSEIKGKWPSDALPAAAAFLKDVERIVSDDAFVQRFEKLSSRSWTAGVGTLALRAFLSARELYGKSAMEGLALGLSRMAGTPVELLDKGGTSNQLEQLFFFVASAQKGSEVILDFIANEAELIAALPDLFRSDFSRIYGGILREEIQRQKWKPAFWRELAADPEEGKLNPRRAELFQSFSAMIEKLGTPVVDDTNVEEMLENRANYFSSYVLTRWFEAIWKEPGNRKKLEEIDLDTGSDEFWNLVVQVPTVNVKFVARANEGGIQFPEAGVLKALGKGKFVARFREFIEKHEDTGDYSYSLFGGNKARTLRDALGNAVAAIEVTRELTGTKTNPVREVVRLLEPEAGQKGPAARPFSSVLDLLHDALRIPSISKLRKVKRLLFEDMKLGHFSARAERRRALNDFLDDEKLRPARKYLLALLDSVQMIYESDRFYDGLPSPLATYRELIRFIPPAHLGLFGDWLELVHDSRIFAWKNDRTPEYAGITAWIHSSAGLFRLVDSLSQLSMRDYTLFLSPFVYALDPDRAAVRQHAKAFKQLVRDERKGVEAFLASLLSGGGDGEWLPPPERAWLIRWIEASDHQRVWEVLSRHMTRDGTIRLVQELKALHWNGHLADAFRLLGMIENPMLRRLASIAETADRNGELLAALELFRIFLAGT